jgi:hypothetical protein
MSVTTPAVAKIEWGNHTIKEVKALADLSLWRQRPALNERPKERVYAGHTGDTLITVVKRVSPRRDYEITIAHMNQGWDQMMVIPESEPEGAIAEEIYNLAILGMLRNAK